MGEEGRPWLEGVTAFGATDLKSALGDRPPWELLPVNPAAWRKSKFLFPEMFSQMWERTEQHSHGGSVKGAR